VAGEYAEDVPEEALFPDREISSASDSLGDQCERRVAQICKKSERHGFSLIVLESSSYELERSIAESLKKMLQISLAALLLWRLLFSSASILR